MLCEMKQNGQLTNKYFHLNSIFAFIITDRCFIRLHHTTIRCNNNNVISIYHVITARARFISFASSSVFYLFTYRFYSLVIMRPNFICAWFPFFNSNSCCCCCSACKIYLILLFCLLFPINRIFTLFLFALFCFGLLYFLRSFSLKCSFYLFCVIIIVYTILDILQSIL